MSDAPRWPGTDGGPGLDFSPYRPEPSPDEAPSDSDQDTQVHSPVSPEEPAASPTDAEADDKSAEADEPKREEGAEARAAEETKGVAPVTPRVAERAARTAQEWAAMPVGPAAAGAAVGAGGVAGAINALRSPFRPAAAPGATEASDPLPLDEVAEQPTSATPAKNMRRPRRTRKARLRLARIDPWSVMKTTFLFAIAFGIMCVVAVFVLWSVLAGAGTLDYVNTLLNTLFGDQDTEFDVTQILSLNRILGFTSIVAVINVVIFTALATLFAFLYNLAATVMGGLEVTLAED